MAKRTAAQKARTVAHHHKHVKPAHAHHKAATGHAHKHHKAAKHHKVAHKHKGQVHRGLAPAADQVASCAAEALAASLRLSGLPVAPADVLALYWRTASDADAGASIVATLEAAGEYGLGGFRPRGTAERDSNPHFPSLTVYGPLAERGARPPQLPAVPSLILGVDLPGPHAVLATPEGWWSWGDLFCPWCEWPDAVIEEAWEVAWL